MGNLESSVSHTIRSTTLGSILPRSPQMQLGTTMVCYLVAFSFPKALAL